jgi:3-phytase
MFPRILFFFLVAGIYSCSAPKQETIGKIPPTFVTDTVNFDSDDPAIWVHPTDPSQSLILGTDKDSIGALYVFNLQGKVIDSLVRRGIQRPNNVDVGYGLALGTTKMDFAVTGERLTS